ncbi:MAG: DUF1800 family protein [Saprospiraceae bacterium]
MPDPDRLSDQLKLSLEPREGPLEPLSLNHLLRRSLYGIKKNDVLFYQNKSIDQVFVNLLSIPSPPSPPLVNYTNGDDIIEPKVNDGDTWINEPWDDNVEYYRLLSLKTWWMDLMLHDQTIFEKMVLFWHNHIPVEMVGVFHGRQAYDYLMTIRKYALGNFKEMIKALTIDPMMLFYLNGNSNEKYAPDENYGRELQELFCIGKGPDSKYTEDDVKSAARVLTGWKTDFQKPKTAFFPSAHDTDDKKFSAFYNSKIIKGRTGMDGGRVELDELIDMIVENPECSKFVCRKLYRFFVYPEVSDWAEVNIIGPLATLFKSNNYEILPVLKSLLSSSHFFDPLLRMSMIKSPMDYSIGLNRHFEMNFPQQTNLFKAKFQAQTVMYYFLTNFQQDIGDPPNVSGWPAYYQYPQYDKSWISTHTIHQRGVHSEMLVWYGYQMFEEVARIDWIKYTATYDNPSDPNALINDVLYNLFNTVIASEIKTHLKTILLSGQMSDFYWTGAWNEWKANPNNEMTRNTVEIRLKLFYQYILQMDEFQLM